MNIGCLLVQLEELFELFKKLFIDELGVDFLPHLKRQRIKYCLILFRIKKIVLIFDALVLEEVNDTIGELAVERKSIVEVMQGIKELVYFVPRIIVLV